MQMHIYYFCFSYFIFVVSNTAVPLTRYLKTGYSKSDQTSSSLVDLYEGSLVYILVMICSNEASH